MGNIGTGTPVQEKTVQEKEPGQEDYENALKELYSGNNTAAVDLLRKAIEADYTMARIQLGLMYRDGRGLDANPREAISLFTEAQGEGLGETQLGLMYWQGLGVDKDIPKAIEYFKEAIEKDNMDAQSHLGFLYVRGHTTDHTVQEGIKLLEEASKKSREADCYLGLVYSEGIGVTRNYTTALTYLNRAVEGGHLEAHLYLAELHMQGKGTARQPWSAAKYLLRAAEKGNARAQCYIGIMYRDGVGVTQNDKMARKWIKSSAEMGDTLGMYSWGKYLLEKEPDEDWTTVVDWLKKASTKGNTKGEIFDDLYIDGLARVFNVDQ